MQIIDRIREMDRSQKLRYALLVFGILAFVPPVGFITQAFGSSMLCGSLCGRMAIGTGLPRQLVQQTAGVVFLLLWFGSTFFFGRWMCSHVCPIGGLTEFASKIVPKRLKFDYSRIFDAPLFRYGFLGAFILLPAAGFASICCSYCAQSTVPTMFGAIFLPQLYPSLLSGTRMVAIGLYVGLFGMLAVDGRGHCHLICPIGAVDSIVNFVGSKLPFTYRLRVDKEQCHSCGTCVSSCPTYAISLPKKTHNIDKNYASGKFEGATAIIDYHRCHQCRICESSCNRKALKLTRAS
jgi:ferredoxin-type protein NapH